MNTNSNKELKTFENLLFRACPKQEIERLAHEQGFTQRAFRKISPIVFVLGLCRGTLNAFPSLNIIAGTIAAITGNLLSKYGLGKRIKQPAVKFLQQLLKYIIAYPLKIDVNQVDQQLAVFSHVWIVDSTSIQLHSSLAEFFPGGRNQTQKQSAILKVQLGFDIRAGILHAFGLSGYTRNDQKASSDIFEIAEKGDLIIRDLGYFSLAVFGKMMTMGIYFISRIPFSVTMFNLDHCPINLLEILKKKNEPFDQDLLVGAKEKLELHVIAIPVPDYVAEKRRQKAKKNRDKRSNHSPEYMELLGWTIFMTNIPNSILPTQAIHSIYAIRWKIEIIFKSWKSFFCIIKIPKASVFYVQCLIYAKLIFIVLVNHTQIILDQAVREKYNTPISPMKFAQFISQPILKFFSPINTQKWKFTIPEYINYYCSYEKRKRKNMAQMIAELIPVNKLY